MEKNLLPSLVESFQVTNPEWIDAKGNFAPELIDALVNTYHIPLKYLSEGEPVGGPGSNGGTFTPGKKVLTPEEHDLVSQKVDAIQEPLQATLQNKESFRKSLPNIQQSLKDADPDMIYHNSLIHKIKFDKGGPYIMSGDIKKEMFNIEGTNVEGVYKQRGGINKGYSDLEARWEKLLDDRIGKETRQNMASRLLRKKVDLFDVRGDYNEEVLEEILEKYPFLRSPGETTGTKRFTKEEREKYGIRGSSMYKSEVIDRIMRTEGSQKLRVTSNLLYELGIGAPSYSTTSANRIQQ
jgi:hypothetical protein